ncbi:MAG: hypothetical protein K9G58_04140 [Bacteroidales bacterium]|nr:hypothetical protein [Bacteroidales bacterium]MCF8397334.1 hypothetical protein [Bacteroidales bacterium]
MKSRERDTSIQEAYDLFDKGDYGKAINWLREFLEENSGHTEARALKEQIERILKFSNIDIYSCTNLFMDPWEE